MQECAMAIPGAIDFRHRQGHERALPRRELAPCERTGSGNIRVLGDRRVGEQVEEVTVGWQ